MELTERLVEARKARGLSQAEAAERLNVSRQAISRWETGVGTPSLDSLIQMSQLYEVSLNELVYGAEKAQPREETLEPERPAVWTPRRRRTALLTAVAVLVVVVMLGVVAGTLILGTKQDTNNIYWDGLVVDEDPEFKKEFDLQPWE